MKPILFGLFLIYSINSFGQTVFDSIPFNENGVAYFEKVFEIKSTKDSLYNKAKLWINQIVTKPSFAIQTDDKENGVLIFNGYIGFYHNSAYAEKKKIVTGTGHSSIKFTVKAFLKDNKSKLVITDIGYYFNDGFGDNRSLEPLIYSTTSNIKNHPGTDVNGEAAYICWNGLYQGIINVISVYQENRR